MNRLVLSSGKKKRNFIIWILLLFIWLLFITIPSLLKNQTGSLIFDPHEYASYYDRGGWIYSSAAPVCEYPQIPTYLFGLTRFVSDSFSPEIQFGVFYAVFSLEMMVALFFLFKVLEDLLPQKNKPFALLMFLPPVLYFVLNRFDILPALICLLAIKKAQKKQWIFASIFLAIGTFTKWYPLLLFPGVFVYASFQENKLNWKMVLAFLLTSMVILLPTFIQGGVAAILAPYQFHFARGMEYVALPVLISSLLENRLIAPQLLNLLFLFIQLSSPLVCVFLKIYTLDNLVDYGVLCIALFILFSRINSPQWFLWLMPFLILSIKDKKDVLLILFYNLITYVFFPIVFNSYGNSSFPLKVLAVTSYMILVFLIVRSVRRITINLKPFFISLKQNVRVE